MILFFLIAATKVREKDDDVEPRATVRATLRYGDNPRLNLIEDGLNVQ